MFSYLATVKNLIDKPVYDRGMVAYLEGGLVGFADLTLDYWREYRYMGTDEYFVKMPVLHLALNPEKFELASKVISELVSCTCPYFLEYGICKHIVAVCASLDKEFSLEHFIKKSKIEAREGDKVLNQIFEAEKTRQTREFNSSLEIYLSSSKPTDFKWLTNFVNVINNDATEYKDILASCHKIVTSSLKKFDLEAKITRILTKTLIFGNKTWWDFWKVHLAEIHPKNMLKLWAEIWEMRVLGLLSSFSKEVDGYLVQLSAKDKDSILILLQSNFKHNPDYWLDFIFVSQHYSWVESNLLSLDPKTLLRAATTWPDMVDEIEPHILEKVKVWLDFLQIGDYDELVAFFKLWLKTLGGGEYYQQAVLYLKEVHGKKRSLINRVSKN